MKAGIPHCLAGVLAATALGGCMCDHGPRPWSPEGDPAGASIIYDGPTPASYRVCYYSADDTPLVLTNESATQFTVRSGANSEGGCIDLRASKLAIASSGHGRIIYRLLDGVHQ